MNKLMNTRITETFRAKFKIINEWDLHENFLDISLGDSDYFLVACDDAIHPFYNRYYKSLNFIKNYFLNNPSKLLVFVSVNNYGDFFKDIKNIKYFWFPEYHSVYYPLYKNFNVNNETNIEKKFLSLNKRADVTRWLLYKKMYTSNLLGDSIFSFLGEDRLNGTLYNAQHIESIKTLLLDICDVVDTARDMQLNEPDKMFVTIDNDLLIDTYKIQKQPNNVDPSWEIDVSLYLKTFCSVISETSMEADLPNFSEKTFKALSSGHVIVLLGAQNSLQYLRDLGFDVFDDVLDNSYDLEPDYYKRLVKVFTVIDAISQKSVEELNVLKHSLKQRRENNIKQYQLLYQQMLDKNSSYITQINRFLNDNTSL